MSTNEKADLKLDKKNNDEPIVEVSPTEADAVAGGIGLSRPPELDPQVVGQSPPPQL